MALVEVRTTTPTLRRPPPERAAWWSTPLPAEWLGRSAVLTAGRIVREPGDGLDVLHLVRSGWVLRSRLLDDGRRQVMEVLLPGDHVSVRAAHPPEHLIALGRCEVVSMPASLVRDARLLSPDLDAWFAALDHRRTAVLNERIVSLGQRTALERTAHLFCEMRHRLDAGDPATACEWPMVQADLADLLGLSVVHTCRTLQVLRGLSLVELGRGWMRVSDPEALARLARFSPDYLG